MSQRGSALLLFPAALLVVLALGAIAVDAAVVLQHQRELATAAAAAANDAATLGLDPRALREEARFQLDAERAVAVVERSLARRGVLAQLSEPPHIAVSADRVEVTLVGFAGYVIAAALPGAPAGREVRATAAADLILDEGVSPSLP